MMRNCELCGARLPNRGLFFVDARRFQSSRRADYQVCGPCFDEHEDGKPLPDAEDAERRGLRDAEDHTPPFTSEPDPENREIDRALGFVASLYARADAMRKGEA